MSKQIDMRAFEQELAALASRIENYLMLHPQAPVFEVEGELDISHEEFMAASAYHQRRGQAYRAARAVQQIQQAHQARQQKPRTTH